MILYGISFWETAATQNCRHPQGISLTSLYEIAESRNSEAFFCRYREVVHHRFTHRAFCLRARVRVLTTLFLFVTFCFCVSGFIKFYVV
jgi:hypothetical protein